VILYSFEENELEEAIAEAEKSDVVILAIGEVFFLFLFLLFLFSSEI